MFFSSNEIVDTQFLFAQTLLKSLFDALMLMRTTGMEVEDEDDEDEDDEDEDDEDGFSCTYFVQFSSLVGLMP